MAGSRVDALIDAARQEIRKKVLRDRKNRSPEVVRLLEAIAEDFFDPSFNVEKLVRAGIVDWRVRKKIRAELGMGLKGYLKELKKKAAAWLLIKTDLRIKDIALGIGYSRQREHNFTRDFKTWTGETPEQYRTARRRKLNPRERWLETVVREARREAGRKPVVPRGQVVCLEGDEEMARTVWTALRQATPARQIEFLHFDVFFGGPELFELLSRESRQAGRRDRRQGVRLAEVALAAVEGSRPLLGELYPDLHALALARLANARRLAGDLVGAEELFQRLEGEWGLHGAGRRNGTAAEIIALRGTLRLFQRRFSEARELLGTAIELADRINHVTTQVNARLQRAAVAGYEGRPGAMIPDLRAVAALLASQEGPDPLWMLGVYHDLVFACVEIGEIDRAEGLLPRAKALCEQLGDAGIAHQLVWVEGMIAKARQKPGDAERLFRQARAGFAEMGDEYSVAMAALEISILCHEEGRSAQALALVATEVIPLLETLELRREAFGALALLRSTVSEDDLPVAVLREARGALLASRHGLAGGRERGPS